MKEVVDDLSPVGVCTSSYKRCSLFTPHAYHHHQFLRRQRPKRHKMPPMASLVLAFSDLHDDALLAIADQLDWSKHSSSEQASLRSLKPLINLSSVNQRLRALLSPRIFRTAHRSYHAWDAISPLCNAHIASLVQTLRLELRSHKGERKAYQDPFNALWKALSALPHLRTLIVAVAPTVRRHFSTALASCPQRTTICLPFVKIAYVPCHARALLRLCPNASHLHITCPHAFVHAYPASQRVTHIYHGSIFTASTLAALAMAYPHTTHLTIQQPPNLDSERLYAPTLFLGRETVVTLPRLIYVEQRGELGMQMRRWRWLFEESGEGVPRVIYKEEEEEREADDGKWMVPWWKEGEGLR